MSNENLELNSYEGFFTGLREFKKTQDKQKQRGLNNYNLLTAVLNPSDEVRLHSRMIHSLLNPNGKHFQGTLFLEKFLEVLHIEDFNVNVGSCTVYKEYENIDLYITDGTKHIIIENKVHAGDQKDQIKRYLELIKKENETAGGDILVLYLTLDRKKPSEYSLGGLSIKDDKVMEGDSAAAFYKSISYKNEIMEWLEHCRHEVQNLSNLNYAVVQYMDVVKMINNEYKGAAMSLADYIKNDEATYAMAVEISKAVAEVRKEKADTYFASVVSKLNEELDGGWVVEIEGNLSTKFGYPLRVYKKDWNKSNCLVFGLEFGGGDFNDCYLGVVRSNTEITIKDGFTDEISKIINDLGKELNTGVWWLHKESFYKPDFIEYIHTEENAGKNLVNTFMGLIDVFETDSKLLTSINKYLNDKGKDS